MLTITDLTYRIAGRTILDRASLSLAAGQKAGLIGRNGTGKSTLLKLIYGMLHADDGEIRMAGKARIGMLSQEAPSGPESPVARARPTKSVTSCCAWLAKPAGATAASSVS